jgi:uncharacterized protein YndB with AHSA1/START domain
LTDGALATTLVHMDDRLHLERSLAASPEDVWQAMTDPVRLAAWFWPPSLRLRTSTDPRPGGSFRIEGSSRDEAKPYELAVSGLYQVVRRPEQLVFSWRWDEDPDNETLVTIGLSAMDGGTSFALTHEGFTDKAGRDDHVVGWSDCLDRLPAHLASTPGTARVVDF